MKINDALDLFDHMNNENIVYAFKGNFNYHVVNTLLSDIKRQLNTHQENRKAAKKTYKVLVECLENIHKHSTNHKGNQSDNEEGIFVLLKKEGDFIVAIGNLVESAETSQLKEQLDEINTLTPEELKQRYRNSIMNAEISEKGGAGLGMIDIAMKSGSILDYDFQDYEGQYSFFSLKVLINA